MGYTLLGNTYRLGVRCHRRTRRPAGSTTGIHCANVPMVRPGAHGRKCIPYTFTMVGSLVVLLAAPVASHARPEGGGMTVRRSRATGLATHVTVRNRAAAAGPRGLRHVSSAPREFLTTHGRMFGVDDSERQLAGPRLRSDRLGHSHSTYQQVHNGVEVFSGILKVHQDASGDVYAANGDVYPIKRKLNTTPNLAVDQASTIALHVFGGIVPVAERPRLVIVDPGWYGDPPTGQRLAYYVIVADERASRHEAFFIDAHSGAVLDRWSLIHTAKYRKVYDAFQTLELPGTLVREEGDAPIPDLEIDHTYDYLGDFYDYLARGFGRDGIDDEGMSLVATVNSMAFGLNCPNAQWISTRRQAIFCTGLTTDDIVAHEMMHGVTQFTADLIYQNQPGQLNEAFSDIFGELVDLFNGNVAFPGPPGGAAWPTDPDYVDAGGDLPNDLRSGCTAPGTPVRWLIGEDWWTIRDMWDPTCSGDPDRALSHLQTCGGAEGADNGGVHSGSGIPNHAFAIMTDGKTFNGYEVQGIGPIKAAAVWYRALTVYLTPSSDFQDAFFALVQSAQDLIGTTPDDPRTGGASSLAFTAEDAAEVEKALRAVEMDAGGVCGATVAILDSTPPELCAALVSVYREDFEGGSGGWTSQITAGEPPTPYDWIVVGDLPRQRSGSAFYCEDPDYGDCSPGADESAVHTLFSPVIELPADGGAMIASFTHYMASETGWDGGNVKIKVDGGTWQVLPESAFTYNEYNTVLLPLESGVGNTNPMASEEAFSGAGGGWGTSLIDVSTFVEGGTNVQFRFDFGKDGCTGLDGWYVDDFELFYCANCPDGEVEWIDPQAVTVDARQPRNFDTGEAMGIDTVEVHAPAGADAACWESCETAAEGSENFISGITESEPGQYVIDFDRPITPGAETTVTYLTAAGPAYTASFTSLPGDSDGDMVARADDIAALVACCLDDACGGYPGDDRCDMNRSESATGEDALRLIDLLNGAGQAGKSWNLESPSIGAGCP